MAEPNNVNPPNINRYLGEILDKNGKTTNGFRVGRGDLTNKAQELNKSGKSLEARTLMELERGFDNADQNKDNSLTYSELYAVSLLDDVDTFITEADTKRLNAGFLKTLPYSAKNKSLPFSGHARSKPSNHETIRLAQSPDYLTGKNENEIGIDFQLALASPRGFGLGLAQNEKFLSSLNDTQKNALREAIRNIRKSTFFAYQVAKRADYILEDADIAVVVKEKEIGKQKERIKQSWGHSEFARGVMENPSYPSALKKYQETHKQESSSDIFEILKRIF